MITVDEVIKDLEAKIPVKELEPLLVKRYKNRKLYCVTYSDYITHAHLIEHLRLGGSFKVICNVTFLDITLDVLTCMTTRLVHDRVADGTLTREKLLEFITEESAVL